MVYLRLDDVRRVIADLSLGIYRNFHAFELLAHDCDQNLFAGLFWRDLVVIADDQGQETSIVLNILRHVHAQGYVLDELIELR